MTDAMTDGLVALVTGGSGGIGAALADRLIKRGYEVVVADIEPRGTNSIYVDVSDLDSCHRMIDTVVRRHGRLDLVALNAGVNSYQRGAQPLDLNEYRRHLGVNLDGVVFGIDAAKGALANPGAIVVTASLAALAPEEANALYAMGKSAVVAYVRAMSPILAEHGITINAVCPSFVDTPMLDRWRDLLKDVPLLDPDLVAAVIEQAFDSGLTGKVWAVVAGRSPYVHDFTRLEDRGD